MSTNTGATGQAGLHKSRLANMLDPRVDSNATRQDEPAQTGYNGTGGARGAHSSRIANTADPRVHSDREGQYAPSQPGYGGSGVNTGTGYGTATNTGYTDPEGTHGPHGNRVANVADPRVDSDRDHRGAPPLRQQGVPGTGTGAGATGHGPSSGVTGYNDPAGTHGPHNNNLANKLDPRVDSDRDNRGAPTQANTGGIPGRNVTGYNDPEGTHGPHSNRLANAADPRVDSDRDGRGAPTQTAPGQGTWTGAGGGSGAGVSTAGAYPPSAGQHVTGYNDPKGTHGPHGSRLANAADPRVDSDRDNQYAAANAPGAYRGTETTRAPGAGAGAGAGATGPTGSAAGSTGQSIGQKIKGAVAQGHGVGESLRGNIMSAVSEATGDRQKQAKHEAIARGGHNEIQTGEFQRKGTTDKAL